MDKPKISIIVPVYNIEKYIERCLTSIISQSFSSTEIIVVNDGATDRSGKIIDRFASIDERILVINKPNGGLSSARNTGIAIAQGEYLLHIDGDDWMEQGYLSAMYKRASNDNLDVTVSDYWKDFDNGVVKRLVDLPITDIQTIDGQAWLNKFFDREANQSMFNKLFRTSLYKDNNIEHPLEVSVGEDLATTPRLMHYAKRIGKINKCYYHYIQRTSSLTNSISKESTEGSLNSLMRAFEILNNFFGFDKNILFQLAKHRIAQIAIFVFTPSVDRQSELMKQLSNEYLYANKNLPVIYSSRKIKAYSQALKIINNRKALHAIQIFNNFATKFYYRICR